MTMDYICPSCDRGDHADCYRILKFLPQSIIDTFGMRADATMGCDCPGEHGPTLVDLRPLPDARYTATELYVTVPDSDFPLVIQLAQNTDDWEPSDRELATWPMTRARWNELSDDDKLEHTSSGHYERRGDYALAMRLAYFLRWFK